MNGELAQVKSGYLDLKSSMLRSCNTPLPLNISAAIGVVYIYETDL
jgi:hypothetical protein